MTGTSSRERLSETLAAHLQPGFTLTVHDNEPRVAWTCVCGWQSSGRYSSHAPYIDHLIDVLTEAGHARRTITTADELLDLADGAVIRTPVGVLEVQWCRTETLLLLEPGIETGWTVWRDRRVDNFRTFLPAEVLDEGDKRC